MREKLVWQETDQPRRFVHLFIGRDEEANHIHGESAAVKKFAGVLYPNCLAPVEFIECRQVDANAWFSCFPPITPNWISRGRFTDPTFA